MTREILQAELEKLEIRLKHDLTLRLGAIVTAGAGVAVLGGLNIFF